jgi:uncharacterized protein with ParB-like and HNH nuclease domain
MVILDGQQRLTTLYLMTRGEIPPYYTENDLKTDPRNLYFDLDSGDFQYFQAMRMRNNPTWIAVKLHRLFDKCLRTGQAEIE